MNDDALPGSEIILYQTEDGRTRVQCRFENETLWLFLDSQPRLVDLDFEKAASKLKNLPKPKKPKPPKKPGHSRGGAGQ